MLGASIRHAYTLNDNSYLILYKLLIQGILKALRKELMELNFSIAELLASDTARIYDIKNTPTLSAIDNMVKLIFYVLQPLRDKLGKPVIITSGFRSVALNAKVGGKNTSQHLTGQAVDIKVNGCSASTLFDYIKGSNIPDDQLVNEYHQWVHISYNHGKNRRQAFEIK